VPFFSPPPPNLSALFVPLPPGRAERWRRLSALVAGWFERQPGGDGCTEENLLAAEARLGMPLPAALRDAYLLFGRREELTVTDYSTMLPPERLRVRGGVLFFWEMEEHQIVTEEWGIRLVDFPLDDPPVVFLDGRGPEKGAAPTPAFAGADQGLSRFFLRMSLDVVIHASDYSDYLESSSAERTAQIAAQFPRLDVGELTGHPTPAFHGGEGVLLRLDEEIELASPNKKSYRRAVKKLPGLPWHGVSSPGFGGSYADFRKRAHLTNEKIIEAAITGKIARRPIVPVPGVPGIFCRPIDERLGALVEAALATYEPLLPPAAVDVLRRQAVAVVDTLPALAACRFMLLYGGPPPAPKIRLRPLSPRIYPIAGWLTEEHWAIFDEPFGDDDALLGFMKRYTPAMARKPPEGPPVSDAILGRACDKLARFVALAPLVPAPGGRVAERELELFLALTMASLFAGIVGSFMRLRKDEQLVQCMQYMPARLAFRCLVLREPDLEVFIARYVADAEASDMADKLGLTVAEVEARHRSFLASLGPALVEATDRLDAMFEGVANLRNPEAAQWASGVALRTMYEGKKMPD
jgi:hypothetical protein